ncbi:Flp family type IVb pilin [Betaproteobacteria bacterium SCN2]|jgi:pilus assembly protein Flp/PilA|nr:Flp family type IVb pilin [Betaproteobacteria bacterium SCN2]
MLLTLTRQWIRSFKTWCHADAGITSIEYALIGVLVAVVIVGAVTTVGAELENTFSYVATCVANLQCP